MKDNGLGIVLFLCTPTAGLPVLLVLLAALVPNYVERARGVMSKWPGRSFLLGLINFIFFFAVALLSNVKFVPIQLLGVLSVLFVLPILLTLGLLPATGVVGERVWRQLASRPSSLLGSLVIGIVAMELTLLAPIVGWGLFLGLVSAGLGASIIALFLQRQPQPESVQAAVGMGDGQNEQAE
jgi:hypothetical protein